MIHACDLGCEIKIIFWLGNGFIFIEGMNVVPLFHRIEVLFCPSLKIEIDMNHPLWKEMRHLPFHP